MSYIDINLTRSNHKVAYGLILQHILLLKSEKEFDGQIDASEISSDLQIPYKTVQAVMHDLHNQGYISNLKQL